MLNTKRNTKRKRRCAEKKTKIIEKEENQQQTLETSKGQINRRNKLKMYLENVVIEIEVNMRNEIIGKTYKSVNLFFG